MIFEIGGKCPACGRVYAIGMDASHLLNREQDKGIIQVAHCPKCRDHPLLVMISKYKLVSIINVKKFPGD